MPAARAIERFSARAGAPTRSWLKELEAWAADLRSCFPALAAALGLPLPELPD
ncbi:hypothetical protein ABGB12_04850 [Actinocorallia sp. B10E7]|uniref:hypothetical protein n=1 Tax=Actinocorallia sp. B10E7 TaxID=3153558 RepID=UPI00325F7747